jgi:hypothetical protein
MGNALKYELNVSRPQETAWCDEYWTARFLYKYFIFGSIIVGATRRDPSGDFAQTFGRGCKEGAKILDTVCCLTKTYV